MESLKQAPHWIEVLRPGNGKALIQLSRVNYIRVDRFGTVLINCGGRIFEVDCSYEELLKMINEVNE